MPMPESSNDLGLSALQQLIDTWIKKYGVRYFDPMTNLGILCEEVGEVARLLVRISGEQSWRVNTRPEDLTAALEEEFADVLWVLCCLANQHNIDLNQAVQKNIAHKTTRDKNRHRNNPKLS